MFYGQEDFRKILFRERFLKKRSLLQLYPTYAHHEDIFDPLWHTRAMTENFMENTTAVAFPAGFMH